MKLIYNNILKSVSKNRKLFSVLIDPDKMDIDKVAQFIKRVNTSIATHIFVGGSIVNEGITDAVTVEIKKHTSLPVVLFPGDVTQITNKADGLLFLSLISGRNPEYLIEKQVQSVSKLKGTTLEVIPTGYILIENGNKTAVERVTKTKPIPIKNIQTIVDTAKAGELLGMQLIYLEAGSGAQNPVPNEIISFVKEVLNIPLIVGGGIKNIKQLQNAYKSGANMVVIGTAFEKNQSFFNELKHNI